MRPPDAFFERLIVRAATIDELLSDAFEALPGQKGDADLAARRLAAWCQSCSSGDWSLFSQRLNRDDLSIGEVLAKFATVRFRGPSPAWLDDAIWIEATLRTPNRPSAAIGGPRAAAPLPFEDAFAPVVERAETLLWAGFCGNVFESLRESARTCLRASLLNQLCELSAPALYDRFVKSMTVDPGEAHSVPTQRDCATDGYDRFIEGLKAGGFRQLFDEKPVLLRLIASITRQWIETSREFIARLDADMSLIRSEFIRADKHIGIVEIVTGFSDPHNHGHAVHIVRFENGGRVVYKPKDLQLDAAWHALIGGLNRVGSPIDLKAARTIALDGYGWTEFIDHEGCANCLDFERFFRRAGAWLALFHCFAATDMHQENMVACGDHPVPIDLEMILQAGPEQIAGDHEGQAQEAAIARIANSVSTVGLLPAYGRAPDRGVFSVGGMNSESNSRLKRGWSNTNTDTMRPRTWTEFDNSAINLPHVGGDPAKFGDYIEEFVSGFEDYAKFLLLVSKDTGKRGLLDDFAGLPVRKVVRPTRFYYMLLQRLRDPRAMDDGAIWSAQIDFLARLGDWESDRDVIWPLHRAERSALIELNVPHFLSPSDGNRIGDVTGVFIQTRAASGLERASARIQDFDEDGIAWQIEVIRQNTLSVSRSGGSTATAIARRPLLPTPSVLPSRDAFIAEAHKIVDELRERAIRKGSGAAWVGSEWLGDSEVSQLVPLGADLYSGVAGIAGFLGAYARVAGSDATGELALAGIAALRKSLKSRSAARMVRSLGIGGATGLGSIVYALTVMSKLLGIDELLADAHAAAELMTDDIIASDKQLDVIGGSAGAILALLRLHRDSRCGDVLRRALKCGDHLLSQRRVGSHGQRNWSAPGPRPLGLNGMSHGAAGFAYALASLSAATGREDFATAAAECIAFENSNYDAERNNWPDLRNDGAPAWRCQWCHGAPGVGLARIATRRQDSLEPGPLLVDVRNAVAGVERNWPHPIDTLCCGTLGSIEFLCEAGRELEQPDLCDVAARRLMHVLETADSAGDYRWNAGKRQFNLGLFRGLAGIGYTVLRQVDPSLPNVLIWE